MNNLAMFILGTFNINEWTFLLTSKGDLGVNAPPQTIVLRHDNSFYLSDNVLDGFGELFHLFEIDFSVCGRCVLWGASV